VKPGDLVTVTDPGPGVAAATAGRTGEVVEVAVGDHLYARLPGTTGGFHHGVQGDVWPLLADELTPGVILPA
jgi:hypothetical protein